MISKVILDNPNIDVIKNANTEKENDIMIDVSIFADLLAVTYKPTLHNPVKVIFNDPATIVFWPDGSKTVVKCENELFDPEKGLAMAIAKKALGNKGNYYNTFRAWLPETYYVDYFHDQLFEDCFDWDEFK